MGKNTVRISPLVYVTGLMAVLGLLLLSMPVVGLNTNVKGANAQPESTPTNAVDVMNYVNSTAFVPPKNPTLTSSEQQAIIDAALNASGVKAWSSTGWQFVTMDFMGVTQPSLQWQYAIINLHLPSNVNAPVACDNGWWAMVKVDLVTKQVISEDEPNANNSKCHGGVEGNRIEVSKISADAEQKPVSLLSLIIPEAFASGNGFSITTEDDVQFYSIY